MYCIYKYKCEFEKKNNKNKILLAHKQISHV